MEEELGAKAPVTRLRRRLSVEQSEESKSPAPSTPTKKRGTRTAKPQLELIEENAAENNTLRRATRRSIARDTVEEEKSLTPSRRSTRIRSNTSLVSETAQTINSPRSKRATRRTSQVGSDNEAQPTTPARTRKARKDSVTVDKPGDDNEAQPTTPARTRKARKDSVTVEKPGDPTIITKVISEEPEFNNSPLKSLKTPESKDTNISPNSLRKSTRLWAKKSPVSDLDSKLNDSLNYKGNDSQIDNNTKGISSAIKKGKDEKRASNSHEQSVIKATSIEEKVTENDLSLSSRNLIDNLETTSLKVRSTINNSITSIKHTSPTQSKRNRTKSWTTMSVSPSKETNFFSDNESAKQKVKSKLNYSKVESEDVILNKSEKVNIETALNSSKRKKRHSLKSNQENEHNLNISVTQKTEPEKFELVDKKMSDKILVKSEVESSDTKKLFEKSPVLIQTKVFIEDSDSNTEVDQLIGDQCVPVVNHVFVNNSPSIVTNPISSEDQIGSSTSVKANESVEPMDIDETMPENVVLNDSDQLNSSIDSTNTSKRKSSISNKTVENKSINFNDSTTLAVSICEENNKSVKKSKRKSPIKNIVLEDNNVSSSDGNISKRKSSVSHDEDIVNETIVNNKSLNVSDRKSSTSDLLTEELNKSTNVKKNKRKSTLSQSVSENIDNKNTKRKSTEPTSKQEYENASESIDAKDSVKAEGENNADDKNKSLNKSKIKSSSNSITENRTLEHNKSLNKSKRKISITHTNLEDSSKFNNESKSTLLLSQIKDGVDTPIAAEKNKSLNVTIEENAKKHNNKNLTRISTSTPLLDKTASKNKKHGTVDISDIRPNEKNITNLIKSKDISDLISSDESEESSDDYESSEAGSGLIIDEADEASKNYESGDSQDDDERQYERENEIIEKGETLTSDDDMSDDSEYEKDSFIVSSDEEDNELLDGSGDDLAMSDNELSMSNKSKKKYNERKKSEQKRASREMFNSRHKLDGSNRNTSKSKSTSKIDSLLLESDDDKSKTKKSKRLRLDSSQETNAINSDANESIIGKKKKAKRLSESILENSTDEKEITANGDKIKDIDPLLSGIEEPKSARQSLNIGSTLPFNCVDIKNVQLDENATILNSNESNDPLQATIIEDEDSDISCNEEIMDNYNNLLNDLNKKKTNKTVDNSLKMNNKSNKNTKEPIMDELNLTVTRKSEKNISESEYSKYKLKENKMEINLRTNVLQLNQDSSSDSIDMKLLFNEDSNDSEDKRKKNEYEGEDFIPLKITEAQTDFQKKEEHNADKSLNTSVKKKKNSISVVEDTPQQMDVSFNTSLRSKKNKKHSLSEEVHETPYNEKLETSLNAPLNVSGKKNKQNISVVQVLNTENEKSQKDKSFNTSMKNRNVSLSDVSEKENNTSTTTGKKKIRNKSISEEKLETSQLDKSQKDASFNTSTKNRNISLSDVSEKENNTSTTTGQKKIRNKSISEEKVETSQLDKSQKDRSFNTSTKNKNISQSKEDTSEKENNTTVIASAKKKKRNKSITEDQIETSQLDTSKDNISKSLNTSVKNKYNSLSEDANESEINTSVTASAKKKHNKNNTEGVIENSALGEQEQPNESLNTSIRIKMSKKLSLSEEVTAKHETDNDKDTDDDDMPDEIPFKSEKNNDVDTENHKTKEETETSKKKRKKKKKTVNQQESIENNEDVNTKRKGSISTDEKQNLFIDEDNTEEDKGKKSKKRKRKLTVTSSTEKTNEEEGKLNPVTASEPLVSNHKNKKQKISDLAVNITEDKPIVPTKQNQNKKRKEREDYTDTEGTKVQKLSRSDKGIPRLPADIISQLEEKPKKELINAKRAKITATSAFDVIEKRKVTELKNQDLETVFLNGETSEQKKAFNKNKSKFLPFQPALATSAFGFTTNFKVSVIPRETKFVAVAGPAEISNFKHDYLSKKLKKMAADHMSRKPRSARLSKF